jgi:DNA-binding transcriptional regulator YiaG
MQSLQLQNMLLLLSLSPVHISRARLPYPRHWKSNQQIPLQPKTLGEEIKKHRLELHWLQADVPAKIGISSTSVSNWERGITSPSRRMTKNLRAFLDYIPPAMDSRKQTPYPRCSRCGISETCPQRCLFERVCK